MWLPFKIFFLHFAKVRLCNLDVLIVSGVEYVVEYVCIVGGRV